MSAKHTPGRMKWKRRPDGSLIYVIGDHKAGPHAQGDIHIDEAGLRRIAACWNACEGISTEALEIGAIQDRIASAFGELYEVKRQRDELLQAIKNLVSVFSLDSEESEVVAVRAAIAKATGKQK